MGQLLPYRSPRAGERTTAYIGMIIFIAAWAMMFACFFFAYGAIRLGTPDWPPTDQPALPVEWPALNLAVIAMSSLMLELGLFAARKAQTRWLAPALGATTLFGLMFLFVQWHVGTELYRSGLKPADGPYASVLYGLAGVHALHVAIGLFALVYLWVQAARGRYNTPNHLPVRLWSIYWHFVGVIWALMFVFVFAI